MAGPTSSSALGQFSIDQPLMGRLANQRVYIGTSSWKYEGWKGLIYQKEYRSKKTFDESCLEEYPYTCVGVDHTYYQWPKRDSIARYCSQTPARMGLKATERVTVFKFPKLPRYGKDAGLKNPDFMSASLFQERFLDPLEEFAPHIGCVMLEFSQFYPGMMTSGREFLGCLKTFIRQLKSSLPIAVEIRNRSWVNADYFSFLRDLGIGHVFNSWTRMPTIGDQLDLWGGTKLPFLASRVLLSPGTAYAHAVEAFSPYNKIQDEQPSLRADVASLITRAIQLGIPAYIFVNNRAEGCAPKTIDSILKLVNT